MTSVWIGKDGKAEVEFDQEVTVHSKFGEGEFETTVRVNLTEEELWDLMATVRRAKAKANREFKTGMLRMMERK